MSITINGSTGISGVDGSSTTPAFQGTDTNTGLFYGTDIVGISTGGSERVRVDASGNVGIGTTSPSTKLHVYNAGDVTSTIGSNTGASILNLASNSNSSGAYNAIISNTASGENWYIGGLGNSNSLSFRTNGGNERMRIDSSGNFLVGTTTGLDGGNGATIKQASYYISSYRVSTTTGNYIHAFYSDVGGTATAKYAIYANGTAGAISDERYKKNIEPSRNYLDDITKINVIKYNWATDDENTPKELGFSAQQVETIFPGLVDTVDNKDADGNVLINQKILKRDVFLPMLVKAIQEQQTIINDLKARVTALEASNV